MITDKNSLGYKIAQELAAMQIAGNPRNEIESRFADLVINQPMWVRLAIADTFKSLAGI